jgi:glycosyltransferase involved in cell wall biosynthesis
MQPEVVLSMRIAQVAPPFETVPPTRYGGTERVVSTLTEELVRRGHEVTLFASGDSQTTARLVPTVDQALWHCDPAYQDLAPFWAVTLGALWNQIDQFDVIHSHLDHFGFPIARACRPIAVTTLHGPLNLPELGPLYRAFPDVPLVSISQAQRRPAPHANWVGNVYHGVDLDEFTCRSQPGSYLAFLGRISPEKGLDVAIRVARRAGFPLKIAAREPLRLQDDPNARRDAAYYQNVIQPLLREPGVEMIGEVGGKDKDTLLREAAALLFPIQWPEPFGLVMIEALACGTPVLALRNGSVPELIDHGLTGWIVDTEDEMVTALDRLGELDRLRCRSEAEKRFSPQGMAVAYEAVYLRLIRQQQRDSGRPHSLGRMLRWPQYPAVAVAPGPASPA